MKTIYYIWMIALAVIFFVVPKSTTADFESEEMKTMNIAEMLTLSTVQVNVFEGKGTAFFVDKNHLITNQHVVTSNKSLFLERANGNYCLADVIKSDADKDLALLMSYCDGIPLKLTDNIKLGQTVLVMGNPRTVSFFLSKGIVSSLREKGKVLTDAYIDFGSSGSPLVNLNGEVVGVIDAKFHDTNIGAAISVQELKEFLEEG